MPIRHQYDLRKNDPTHYSTFCITQCTLTAKGIGYSLMSHYVRGMGNAQSYLCVGMLSLQVRDFKGNTALHLAACTNHISTVTLLLESGSDLQARDGMGRTPLHFAQSHLKLLAGFDRSNTDLLKGKVAEIARMIQVYIQRMHSGVVGRASQAAGNTDAGVAQIDNLAVQLEKSTTIGEIDAVTDLLSSFTSLSIEQLEQRKQ
eukprot:m.94901 g.94901  ORF g.94901 m.94901 type:complete len:203 (-) comp16577_c0_seq3:168-776(-)